jgi:hypothetical protein
MTDRKKPTTGFWITVALVAVLVGYPLSIGPMAYLAQQPWAFAWSLRYYDLVYWPIMRLARTSEATTTAYIWYTGMWPDDTPPAYIDY